MPPWILALGVSGIVASYLYRKYGTIIPPWFDTTAQNASFDASAPNAFQTIMYHAISLRPSQYALDFIKRFEKWSPTMYDATGQGDWTIGWGHKVFGPNDPLWNAVIDQAQGDAMLTTDVDTAATCIQNNVQVPLSQSQMDALTSFVFNIGCTKFINYKGGGPITLLRLLNNGDYQGAAVEFTKWVYAGGNIDGGLIDRRVAEQSTFMTGTA